MKRTKGIKLQVIISLLVFLVIAITVAITWAISINTYKQYATEHHMTNNLTYVNKISRITEHHLEHMLHNLISIANLEKKIAK